ncbi:MAG: hypothetical protein LQ349_008801 [Xanthoria aureola]|nr:MAG: hypothetical protein LQ349_008801 [Xanthoria aureola]
MVRFFADGLRTFWTVLLQTITIGHSWLLVTGWKELNGVVQALLITAGTDEVLLDGIAEFVTTIKTVFPSTTTFSPSLVPDPASHVRLINPKTVAKTDDAIRLTEAATMRFVRSKTSVPVLEVIDAFVHPEANHPCILMEYIDGRPLDQVWDTYSELQKKHVLSQLKGYLEELRQIKGTFIGSVDGTCGADQFFDGEDNASYGPYDSETAFNDGLVRALEAKGAQHLDRKGCEIYPSDARTWHRLYP